MLLVLIGKMLCFYVMNASILSFGLFNEVNIRSHFNTPIFILYLVLVFAMSRIGIGARLI